MAEMKNSAVLDRVFERAKTVDQKINPAMTAERFLIALVDEINNVEDPNVELKEVKKIVDEHKIDLVATRQILMEHISGNSMAFLDGIYMQKIMYEAKALAEQKGEKELSTGLLLSCILADPSDAVKKVLVRTDEAMDEQSLSDADLSAALEAKFDELFGKIGESDTDDSDSSTTVTERKTTIETEEKKISKTVKTDMSALVSDVKRIREELQSSVYGQDNAINTFVTGYFQASMLSMIDKSRKRPRATFCSQALPVLERLSWQRRPLRH